MKMRLVIPIPDFPIAYTGYRFMVVWMFEYDFIKVDDFRRWIKSVDIDAKILTNLGYFKHEKDALSFMLKWS